MNKVALVGNLTRTPEKRTTPNGTAAATFTVAVQRRYKNADGEYDADFIQCVAWRQTAEFITKYFKKGSKIGITGSLQTRTYEDGSGNKRYVTEVLAEEAEFAGANRLSDQKTDNDIAEIGLNEWNGAELPF